MDGTHPSTVSCKKYIQCYEGQLFESYCNNDLVYNPEIGGCDYPANTDCDIPESEDSDGMFLEK